MHRSTNTTYQEIVVLTCLLAHNSFLQQRPPKACDEILAQKAYFRSN
uniref:Uncharacterized protein n=1 Tax=Arundo donax TaxID=35708 RepID=A0A0A9HA47_ARUDO